MKHAKHYTRIPPARIAVLLFLCVLVAQHAQGEDGHAPAPLKLTILHTNDQHGHFWKNEDGEYGMAARKTLIDRIRGEVRARGGHCLLLSGGDVNSGVPESDRKNAEPDFRGMKLLGYDAMAVGNHEFDHPLEVLMQQRKWAGFPFLSANIFYKDSRKRLFPAHTDFTFDGHTVRVVGFTTFRTPVASSPGNTAPFEFRNETQVAAEIIPRLREGCHVLIGLSHAGHRGDIRMAARVDGFDLIVGAHSETTVFKPVERNGCYIVQAGNWGRYVGRADLVLNSGELVLTSYRLIPVNLKSHPDQPRIAEDKRVYEFLKTFQDEERDLLYEPIANNASDLGKGDLLSLIAEAMRDSVESEHPRISLMNSGGCRISHLPKGVIRYRDVLMVLPFSNKLCHVTLTGRELAPLLDAARRTRAWRLAGVTFEGNRPMVNAQPLGDGKRYTFITNDFIASGGDGFPRVNKHPSFKLGEVDHEAFRRFLRKLKNIKKDPPPGGAGR